MAEFQLPKLTTRVRFPSLAPMLLSLFFFVQGCATSEMMPAVDFSKMDGVVHKVQKGETLWRIAKAYNVKLDEIVKVNRIKTETYIEQGQRIFVPGAAAVKDITLNKEDPNKDEFSWPVYGKILTYFGERKGNYLSTGVGIQAKRGDAVRASRQGHVIFADYLSGYGYTVVLDHADGFFSIYSQNEKLSVNLNQFVFKGDKIAEVGSNGNLAFSHFEIRKEGKANNPLFYLPKL